MYYRVLRIANKNHTIWKKFLFCPPTLNFVSLALKGFCQKRQNPVKRFKKIKTTSNTCKALWFCISGPYFILLVAYFLRRRSTFNDFEKKHFL